jgi:hypothetical protein
LKKFKIITLITLLCFICTIPVFAAVDWDKEPKNYDVKVFVDNKDNEVKFPAGMGKPFIALGRTFVPYRIMCESLGAKVAWNESARKVTAEGNNSKVELFIGKSNYKVNGTTKKMDVEPFILKAEGRTYIPARYLTEGLNYTIDFAQDGKVMFICSFTKGQSQAEMKAVLNEIVEANKQVINKPQQPGTLPPGVRNMPAWGKLPTIPVEKGVEVDPPITMTHVYDIDIDTAISGAIDNGCAILADIMDDPSAGEKAKAIILEAKKDDLWANFSAGFESGKHHISVAGPKSPMAYITIRPLK